MTDVDATRPGFYELSLVLPRAAALAVTDLLQGLGDTFGELPDPVHAGTPEQQSPLSVTAFEVPGSADFRVSALFSQPPETGAIAHFLAPLIDSFQMTQPELAVSTVADRDWVSESLKELPAISAGRFYIAGAHAMPDGRTHAIRLQIDAGQAFGTGHHETTTGCLLALDHLARQRRFDQVLDLGCGTGILAMAAAKLWHTPVLASDIDPVAIQVTRQNARQNGLAALITPVVAPGFQAPPLMRNAPYDLIIANILARPLMALAHPLHRHLAREGVVILSGLLNDQAAAILAAYRLQGIYLYRRIRLGDWCTLILAR